MALKLNAQTSYDTGICENLCRLLDYHAFVKNLNVADLYHSLYTSVKSRVGEASGHDRRQLYSLLLMHAHLTAVTFSEHRSVIPGTGKTVMLLLTLRAV